jgi:hypothetical protein
LDGCQAHSVFVRPKNLGSSVVAATKPDLRH